MIAEPRRVRDRIGYMGQKVSLYQGITLRENVEFYAGLYGIDGAQLESRWGAVRERFALGDAEDERPESLPAGLRQRAGLALATLHEPRLLFLDEPTAGVDVASRDLFWQIIQDEAAAGRTVFATTHFLEEAEYCDHVSFIAEGRLVANATPEELRAAQLGRLPHRGRLRALGDGARATLAAAGFAPRGRLERRGAAPRAARRDGARRARRGARSARGRARVRIEQASMNEVFTRAIDHLAAASPSRRAAPAGGCAMKSAPPAHAGRSRSARNAARSLHADHPRRVPLVALLAVLVGARHERRGHEPRRLRRESQRR